jgi:ABC-type multidrug transport system fused ATPase/permease subunit
MLFYCVEIVVNALWVMILLFGVSGVIVMVLVIFFVVIISRHYRSKRYMFTRETKREREREEQGVVCVLILLIDCIFVWRYQRLNDKWEEYVEKERRTFEEKTREHEQQERVKAAEEKEKERQRQRRAFPTKWKKHPQREENIL